MGRALLRKALADVWRRPIRTILVILGILFGVFALVAINVSNSTITEALNYSANETKASNIQFYAQSFDPAWQGQLAAVPNVTDVQFLVQQSVRWQVAQSPSHERMYLFAYADPQHVTVDPFQVTSGRLPGMGEVALDYTDTTLSTVHLGDTITVVGPDGPEQLRVVGLTRTLGAESASFRGYATGIVSLDSMQALSGSATPNEIAVHVRDTSQIDGTIQALRQILLAHSVTIESINYDPNPFGSGPLQGVFTIMSALAIVALLLSALLIFNTVTTLVTEQTKIIGTMKAIGGTRQTIVASYLMSVLIYGIAGSVLGLIAGVFGGIFFSQYIASIIIIDLGPFQLPASAVVLALAVGLGVPLLAALAPLINGTRITAREAMSGYGIVAGNGRERASRAPSLPGVVQVGLRGLFRQRWRAALTLATLALAGTAFLAIQTTTSSVNATLNSIFSTINYDVQVSVTPTDYGQLQADLLAVPNVAHVERFSSDVFQTHWGYLVLQGYEADTQVYRYDLLKGRWLSGSDPGAMVISDLVAQRTGLQVGDTVTFSNVISTMTWHIVGEVHDDNGGTGLIGVALTTYENMQTFNGRTSNAKVSAVLVQAHDRSTAAVDRLATAIDNALSAKGLDPNEVTRQQEIDRNNSQFAVLYAILYAVAIIVALVGVLGLANTLTTSVLERRREIGILRSMGASSRQVGLVFWTEGISLGVIAWLIGVIIGIPAAIGFVALIGDELLHLEFTFNPISDLLMLLVILLVVTVASLGPALTASRARIADILRYE
jgi:putative ABC transport system permease protein